MTTVTFLTLLLVAGVSGVGRFRRNCGPPYEYVHFDCKNRQPGLYADVYRECHTYYVCEANSTDGTLKSCPEGGFFDDRVKGCVPELLGSIDDGRLCGNSASTLSIGDDEFDCRGRPWTQNQTTSTGGYIESFYANSKYGCRQFFVCFTEGAAASDDFALNGQGLSGSCSDGYAFSERFGSCMSKANVECECWPLCPYNTCAQ